MVYRSELFTMASSLAPNRSLRQWVNLLPPSNESLIPLKWNTDDIGVTGALWSYWWLTWHPRLRISLGPPMLVAPGCRFHWMISCCIFQPHNWGAWRISSFWSANPWGSSLNHGRKTLLIRIETSTSCCCADPVAACLYNSRDWKFHQRFKPEQWFAGWGLC